LFTVCFKIRTDLNCKILFSLIFISSFRWILPSRLLAGRLTAHLKRGWPGARVGQIEDAFPYHLQGANGTASVHKFPAVKTGRQGEFGAGS
jgi:hypothetical protein